MILQEDPAVDLDTPTGPMRTYVYRPAAPGRYPGLVFFSEIFQRTGPIKRTAALLAGHGFVVAVPEIFHDLKRKHGASARGRAGTRPAPTFGVIRHEIGVRQSRRLGDSGLAPDPLLMGWGFAAFGDEAVDAGFELGQRDGAEGEDGVVERPEIELRPQSSLGLGARFLNLHLAEIVGKGLTRPGDVTVDLGGDFVFGECGVVAKEREGAVARPAFRVEAGVDHQARRAPHLVGQHSKMLIGLSLIHI